MKGVIYYVAIAKVIFSHVKITCYFHMWRYQVFARKLTWYFIGVYIIKRFILWVVFLKIRNPRNLEFGYMARCRWVWAFKRQQLFDAIVLNLSYLNRSYQFSHTSTDINVTLCFSKSEMYFYLGKDVFILFFIAYYAMPCKIIWGIKVFLIQHYRSLISWHSCGCCHFSKQSVS